MPIVVARLRVPVLVLGVLLAAASPLHRLAWISWSGVVLILVSVASTFLSGLHVQREPTAVHPPVHGRWIAVNSPADKVPSHGVHSAGQTYAIDLVYWPDASRLWQSVHGWPLMRRPSAFPGFGQPIVAPADATVIRCRSRWRDHWSRNSWPALLYLMVEGAARELIGPGGLLGNHVILKLNDGTYAALAHLKRGSITVTKGQVVRAGQRLAECGSSGNSSEPHIHFQLMDTARTAFAAGLPFRFAGYDMPRSGTFLVTSSRSFAPQRPPSAS
jgi:Peptidase family M23